MRLGSELRGLSDLPDCTIVDKPVPLRLLDRFVNAGRT